MSNGPEVNDRQITTTRAPGFIEQPTAAAAQTAQGQAFGLNPESYITSASRNLAGQTVRGDFLNPQSNPYLQSTFNRGADAIQNRLDSQFSGAGRNIGASRPVAADELGSFASQLFGGNYQAERDRQQNTLFQSSQFDPINQLINRLSPLGQLAGRTTDMSRNMEESPSAFDMFTQGLDAIFPG